MGVWVCVGVWVIWLTFYVSHPVPIPRVNLRDMPSSRRLEMPPPTKPDTISVTAPSVLTLQNLTHPDPDSMLDLWDMPPSWRLGMPPQPGLTLFR